MAEERIHPASSGGGKQFGILLLPIVILVPALLLLLVVKPIVLLGAAGALAVLILSLRRRYRLAILIGLLPFSHAGVGIEALPGFGVYDLYSLWFLCIVLSRWMYGGLTLRGMPFPILAGAALVLAFIPSLLNSPPMFEFMKATVQLIISVGTLAAVYAELREEEDGGYLMGLLQFFVVEAAAVAMYGTYQTYTASSIISVLSGRVSAAFFEEVNYFAGYLLMAFPLAISFLLNVKGRGQKLLFGAAALALGAGIISTVSRSGIVVLILLVIAHAVYLMLQGRRKRFAGVAVVIGFVGLVGILLTSEIGTRFVDLFTLSRRVETFVSGQDASFEQRQAIIGIALGMISEHPVVGVGFGSFEQTFDRFKGSSLSTGFARSAHNTLLRIFAETGIMGLFGGLVFIGSLVRYLFRGFGRTTGYGPRMLVFGLGLSLCSFLVMSLTLDQMYEPHFWVLAAMAIALVGKREHEDIHESL